MTHTDEQIEAAALAIINKARADDEDVVLAPLSSLSQVHESYAAWARETARAALEAAERAAWRPIETAPKDGAKVLVSISRRNNPSLGRMSLVAAFVSHRNYWACVEGDPIYPPIAWRPLPQPPEDAPEADALAPPTEPGL